MLSAKGLFTPFWSSLQFIYLHKEEALIGQFLMNKRPRVIPLLLIILHAQIYNS